MTPHQQTIRSGRHDGHTVDGVPGNCLQTAVASLLDLPVEDVPHFALYVDWFGAMRRWARSRGADFGYYPQPVPEQYAESWGQFIEWARKVNPFLLADGPSPRGDFWHVVIVNPDLDLVHDPHPSRAGLVEVKGVYAYCEPFEPGPVTLELTA